MCSSISFSLSLTATPRASNCKTTIARIITDRRVYEPGTVQTVNTFAVAYTHELFTITSYTKNATIPNAGWKGVRGGAGRVVSRTVLAAMDVTRRTDRVVVKTLLSLPTPEVPGKSSLFILFVCDCERVCVYARARSCTFYHQNTIYTYSD